MNKKKDHRYRCPKCRILLRLEWYVNNNSPFGYSIRIARGSNN